MRPSALTTAIAALLQILGSAACADEGGTPFWVSGQFASLAAVPPSPGWSLNMTAYGYDGNAGASRPLPIGDFVTLGAHQQSPSFSVQPGYAPGTTLLGGQPFAAIAFGAGCNRIEADASFAHGAVHINRSGSLCAGTDLYPFASLGWTHGNDNWMAYVTGDIPVGAYQSARLANIGIGHGAIDAGAGYTYYDPKDGFEASIVAGLTFNWQNRQTSYRNGIDSHLDWSLSKFASPNWNLGIAGYVYDQVTGDSGSGAVLGPFKSRVAALGPQAGYQFNVGGRQWQANLRAYREFGARNRYEGHAIFATLNIPLTTE